jgi:tetratricopeptide (TPR) repeat protein
MSNRWFVAFLLVLPVFCLAQDTPTKVAYDPQSVQEVRPLGAPTPPDLSKMTADQLEELGDISRSKKDMLTALDCFNEALKKTTEPAVVYNKIGMTYLSMGQWKKAKAPLQRSIKIDKNYADAHNNLGVALFAIAGEEARKHKKTPNLGGAIKEYKKALSFKPDSASFHSNLGTAYFQQKDYELGLVEYRAAFALDPHVFERSNASGISAQMNGPADMAKFSYTLAKLYASTGQNDKALQALRRALEDGFNDFKEMYKAPEFAQLVKDERFVELMKQRPQAIPVNPDQQ